MTQKNHLLGDANNLYGWAMSQPLPISDFEWILNPEKFDIETLAFDQGATLEVDLRYTEEPRSYMIIIMITRQLQSK